MDISYKFSTVFYFQPLFSFFALFGSIVRLLIVSPNGAINHIALIRILTQENCQNKMEIQDLFLKAWWSHWKL